MWAGNRLTTSLLSQKHAGCSFGNRSGRLGQVVREEQGLAYDVYSRLNDGLGPAPFTADIIGDRELYGLGLDYLATYPDKIRGITAEAVQTAVRQHIPLDGLSIAVAGG